MTLMPVTFRHHVDTSPEAVQRRLREAYVRVARLAVEHEAELSPAALVLLKRMAFSLWLDAREPVRTTPIREVVG